MKTMKFRGSLRKFPLGIRAFSQAQVFRPAVIHTHGHARVDEFAYIKDRPVSRTFLNEENQNFEDLMRKIEPNYQKYRRVVYGRQIQSKPSVPEKYGEYEYYSAFREFNRIAYEVTMRRKIGRTKTQSVFDLARVPIVKDPHRSFVEKFKLTDDHTKLAYTIDLDGSEIFYLGVHNLAKGYYYKDHIPNCGTVEWAKDSKSFFYTEVDEKRRPYKVKQHYLSDYVDDDKTLYVEEDERFVVELSQTKDTEFITINSNSRNSSEVRVIDRSGKDGYKIHQVSQREKDVKCYLEHLPGKFIFVTNAGGSNEFRIMKIDDSLEKLVPASEWKPFWYPECNQVIDEVDVLKNHIVFYTRKNGTACLEILDRKEDTTFQINLDDDFIGKITPGVNASFDQSSVRFHVSTPFDMGSTFELDLQGRKSTLIDSEEHSGQPIDKSKFEVRRVSVAAHDGEEIPMTIISSKGLKKDRKNRVILKGYGAYGISENFEFNPVHLAALENDWVIAFSHIRGGQEKGSRWHREATKMGKHLSFRDYISCAEYLVARRYSHPSLMAAVGGSAGGLLVASVINERPDLFKAAVINVPFTDPLNTLADKTLALTIPDFDEFGDPMEDKDIYHQMLSYSPYENVTSQHYPHLFVTAAVNDTRVPFWGVQKWVMKMRKYNKIRKNEPILCKDNLAFKIDQSGGHFGDNEGEYLDEKIMELAFLDKVIPQSATLHVATRV